MRRDRCKSAIKRLKGVILVSALLSAPSLSSAVDIKVNEDVTLSFGAWLKVWGGYVDKGITPTLTLDSSNTQRSANVNLVYPAWWFMGKAYGKVDFALIWIAPGLVDNGGNALGNEMRLIDGFINFNLSEEFKITAGQFRAPYTRLHLTNEGTYVTETGPIYRGFAQGLAVSPVYRDKGVTLWGNIANGMFQYRLGLFDGLYNKGNTVNNQDIVKDNLAYVVRVQFSPTMLGFSPEVDYLLSETYLGQKDIFTVGASYSAQKWETGSSSDTAKMWSLDFQFEKKFGDIVPNLGAGLIQTRDFLPALSATDPTDCSKYEKCKLAYAEGQVLYDQKIGVGKPALGLRWEYQKPEGNPGGGIELNRYQVWLNYYLNGHSAKVMIGADVVDPSSGSTRTNATIAAQVIF
jgi:hypothetical protein